MPALVKRSVGSEAGTSDDERTLRCPRSSKKRRNVSRISRELIIVHPCRAVLLHGARFPQVRRLRPERTQHPHHLALGESPASQTARQPLEGPGVQRQPLALQQRRERLLQQRSLIEAVPRRFPGGPKVFLRHATPAKLLLEPPPSETHPLRTGEEDIIGQPAIIDVPRLDHRADSLADGARCVALAPESGGQLRRGVRASGQQAQGRLPCCLWSPLQGRFPRPGAAQKPPGCLSEAPLRTERS